jgi:hypothetical protein
LRFQGQRNGLQDNVHDQRRDRSRHRISLRQRAEHNEQSPGNESQPRKRISNPHRRLHQFEQPILARVFQLSFDAVACQERVEATDKNQHAPQAG